LSLAHADLWSLIDRRIRRHVAFVEHIARRGTILSVSAGGKMQARGFGATDAENDDEQFDDVDFWQAVGFASRPKRDDAVLILAIGGHAAHAIAVASRGPARPDLAEGDAAVFNHAVSALVKVLEGGDVDLLVAATKAIRARTSANAPSEKVALKSDVENHSHAPGTYTAPPYGGPVTGFSAGGNTGTYLIRGAKVLEAEGT
jgi:phage gp45-like